MSSTIFISPSTMAFAMRLANITNLFMHGPEPEFVRHPRARIIPAGLNPRENQAVLQKPPAASARRWNARTTRPLETPAPPNTLVQSAHPSSCPSSEEASFDYSSDSNTHWHEEVGRDDYEEILGTLGRMIPYAVMVRANETIPAAQAEGTQPVPVAIVDITRSQSYDGDVEDALPSSVHAIRTGNRRLKFESGDKVLVLVLVPTGTGVARPMWRRGVVIGTEMLDSEDDCEPCKYRAYYVLVEVDGETLGPFVARFEEIYEDRLDSAFDL